MTTTFADDKDCKKNDDNNCNETKKTQKSSSKVECEVDIEIKDHNKNSIVGPTDLQCNSNSQSLIDSDIGSRTGDGIGGGDGDGNAKIEISPTSGPIGTSVHVTGSGFDQFSDVLITFDSSNVALTSTNNNGNFEADMDVPISVPGPHTVGAAEGINSDSATFTVTSSSNPVITIDPAFGQVGTSVNVAGINFDPDSDVLITFDSSNVVLTKTNLTGAFSAVFTVPTSTTGQHIVAAADGINSDSTVFEVTSGTASTSNQQQSAAAQGMLPF